MKPNNKASGEQGAAARASAAKALHAVLIGGQSLNKALPAALTPLTEQDRGAVQNTVYGVLRWRRRLEALAGELLQRPLKSKDADIRILILCGLYECLELRTPPHAVVAATAGAARTLRKNWAVGLINALLRRFLREQETLSARVDRDVGVAYSHPDWLLKHLQTAWPNDWEAITAANNRHPPMTLRVNRRRSSRAEYLELLAAAQIEAFAHPCAKDAITLKRATAVNRLPRFGEGWVSVQDAAAQRAALLLDVPAGARVLDACAAPGGKTCHILERQPQLSELVAVDIEPERLQRVQQNLDRLALAATLTRGDAADPQSWWDGEMFQRILLDAPCSGSGVIRRHPDIKWLRRPEDINALARLQGQLLKALWPLLAPGGKLVYATCSVFPEENEAQIANFVATQPQAQVEMIAPEGAGRWLEYGLQVLPGEQDLDGFYYACLSKH